MINAQEGKTKALRQWRIKSVDEVEKDSQLIRSYVEEARLNQKQGKEIRPVKEKKSVISPELNIFLDSNPKLNENYYAFSAAKQREFSEYINEAKKAETKQKRLEKIGILILQGKGLYLSI